MSDRRLTKEELEAKRAFKGGGKVKAVLPQIYCPMRFIEAIDHTRQVGFRFPREDLEKLQRMVIGNQNYVTVLAFRIGLKVLEKELQERNQNLEIMSLDITEFLEDI